MNMRRGGFAPILDKQGDSKASLRDGMLRLDSVNLLPVACDTNESSILLLTYRRIH